MNTAFQCASRRTQIGRGNGAMSSAYTSEASDTTNTVGGFSGPRASPATLRRR
jgi:hypothetical protein